MAADDQEFVDLALALAHDRPRLAAMRRRIEDAVRDGTGNAQLHARALEDA